MSEGETRATNTFHDRNRLSRSHDEAFCLLWTIGFSGKRFLPSDEELIRNALKQALHFLCAEARKQDAQLTAVSSLARGADVLFSEVVREPHDSGLRIQWKCLLPFHWGAFIEHDLAEDEGGEPLTAQERDSRQERAERCYRASLPAAVVTSGSIDLDKPEQREEAYLDCGYRVVDESDVLVLVLRRAEIDAILARGEPEVNRAGTSAIARYALAAKRPVILLPADAADPWRQRTILNDPTTESPPSSWLVDPMVTAVIRRAKGISALATGESMPVGLVSERGKSVWKMQQCLTQLANEHQGTTLRGFRGILRLHLTASALAALMVTVLRPDKVPSFILWCLILVALTLAKPFLALCAWFLERRLHHRGDREEWIQARILAELCRGALCTWPLPLQPLDASDEEDFPRVKRLIRTLRLLREQDETASTRGTTPLKGETQLEADMRAACDIYIQQRLVHQAKRYYLPGHKKARRSATRWHGGFTIATWSAIGCGMLLAAYKIAWAFGENSPEASKNHSSVEHWYERTLEAMVIIAPFIAAHCLGMMAILDCRRRENRYSEMQHYLRRLADTLKNTKANPSRIRIIEHAERLMIEEQHEWFSVMRNLSV